MFANPGTKRKSSENPLAELLRKEFHLKDDSREKLQVEESSDSICIKIPEQGHYSDGSPSPISRVVDYFKGLGVTASNIKETYPIPGIEHITTTSITLTKSQSEEAIRGLALKIALPEHAPESKPENSAPKPKANDWRC